VSDAAQKICVRDTTPVCERIELLQEFAVRGSVSPIITALALKIRDDVRLIAATRVRDPRGDWYQWLLAQAALDEVHKLPYVPDPPTEDCYRDVELTARQGAECKGLNVFYVALLLRVGIRAEVVWIDQPGMPLNHVTSRVLLDDQQIWADASIRGARLGESPYEALQRTGAWHVVGGAPR
jgi:hypothetical protein